MRPNDGKHIVKGKGSIVRWNLKEAGDDETDDDEEKEDIGTGSRERINLGAGQHAAYIDEAGDE